MVEYQLLSAATRELSATAVVGTTGAALVHVARRGGDLFGALCAAQLP